MLTKLFLLVATGLFALGGNLRAESGGACAVAEEITQTYAPFFDSGKGDPVNQSNYNQGAIFLRGKN